MLFAGISGASIADAVAVGEVGVLRGRSDHHQPTPIINAKTSATAAHRNLRDARVDAVSDWGTTEARSSQGGMMRNKSIGMEMFFNSVGANFWKRASSVLRICRSTSIETQMPPGPANGSIREAMFTPSP